jgi:adenylosuccinate lyase
MANTLGQFAKDMRQLAEELPQRANKVKQTVARTINFDLLETTPVDTGQAVSNWIVTLDEPASETRPAFVEVAEGGMRGPAGAKQWTHRADTEATRQANIAEALPLANQTIDSATPEQPIYITNNLDYIQALDEGHSAQAQNFVERAIILGRDVLNRANILGKSV